MSEAKDETIAEAKQRVMDFERDMLRRMVGDDPGMNHLLDALFTPADDFMEQYIYHKTLPDGRLCGIARLMFHYTMHVDANPYGYEDRYCYQTAEGAVAALMAWDGTGDPDGWHRHPKTGRRRDLATGEERIAW